MDCYFVAHGNIEFDKMNSENVTYLYTNDMLSQKFTWNIAN